MKNSNAVEAQSLVDPMEPSPQQSLSVPLAVRALGRPSSISWGIPEGAHASRYLLIIRYAAFSLLPFYDTMPPLVHTMEHQLGIPLPYTLSSCL
jgi:hypothetical protein